MQDLRVGDGTKACIFLDFIVFIFWLCWVFIATQVFSGCGVDACVSVAQSCPTLRDPMDSSPPGSSVYGIFQARTLEWVAISSSRESSSPTDRICISSVSLQQQADSLPLSHLRSPQLQQVGTTLHCSARASQCSGFSCCRSWILGTQAQQLWPTGLVVRKHVESSQTKVQTQVLCIDRWISHHQTTRGVPKACIFKKLLRWF